MVGFLCGVQNVVGGAAYQVLLAQLAGRERLVEANAKVALGETSAALVGPGLAGGLIQLVTAPFAIVLDALAFFASAVMLGESRAQHDVPHPRARASVTSEIREGLRSCGTTGRSLRSPWLAGLWQILHHMQLAVLILFATRELGLSAGAIGLAYFGGGLGCVLASAFAQRLSARLGVGPVIVHGLALTALAWQAFGLISGSVWFATIALGCAMLVLDFGAILFGINYLALRQAITPDRLLGRMTATMRFLGVGPVIVHGLALTALGWQAFGLISGPVWLATLGLGCAMLVFDFGAVLYGINYLSLRQAITPDRLLGRMTATMRFLTVAAAPLGSLAGGALATGIGLRATLLTVGVLALVLVAGAVIWSPVRRHREMPVAATD